MDYLRELNIASVVLRLFLATAFGGVIGMERGGRGQPAGLRTHILVCMGSCLAMLSNLYLVKEFPGTDPSRFGAQVISGIGFLGVGTIIVTGMYRVKGLTTAAGLWASACMGIAVGAGFYEGAAIAFVTILLAMTVLHRLEIALYAKDRIMLVYAELTALSDLRLMSRFMKENGIRVLSADISSQQGGGLVSVVYRLKGDKGSPRSEELVSRMMELEYVLNIEELR
jgi:putative Mg2+ transporter-C (MgtC) family protein